MGVCVRPSSKDKQTLQINRIESAHTCAQFSTGTREYRLATYKRDKVENVFQLAVLHILALDKMATDRRNASKIGVVKPFGVCYYNVNVINKKMCLFLDLVRQNTCKWHIR